MLSLTFCFNRGWHRHTATGIGTGVVVWSGVCADCGEGITDWTKTPVYPMRSSSPGTFEVSVTTAQPTASAYFFAGQSPSRR